MTRKDYELIAFAIKDAQPMALEFINDPMAMYEKALYHAASSLAFHLSETNPRFDQERFMKACGVTE